MTHRIIIAIIMHILDVPNNNEVTITKRTKRLHFDSLNNDVMKTVRKSEKNHISRRKNCLFTTDITAKESVFAIREYFRCVITF